MQLPQNKTYGNSDNKRKRTANYRDNKPENHSQHYKFIEIYKFIHIFSEFINNFFMRVLYTLPLGLSRLGIALLEFN